MRISGTARTGLPIVAMIVMLSLSTAVTALAGGGGVSSDGGGDGATSGSSGGDRYDREWDSFSRRDRKWARSTSECESNQDARIHDGSDTFHGAFQFMKSTWKSSPMSPGGDPHTYRWKVQAVVAVKLMHRDSDEHWPYCGDR